MRAALLLALCLSTSAFADATAPSPGGGKSESLEPCPGSAPADGAGKVTPHRDRIDLAEPIVFETGKAEVKASARPVLAALAAVLGHVCGTPLVEVQVHSDARGADDYNLRMSQARAESIVKALVGLGVAPERLRARGYGETKPLCAESNEACWARNRRTEIVRVLGK